MDISNRILDKYNEIFNNLPSWGEGNLKFGDRLVRISSIATQYYCEQKLELQHHYPLPPTKIMQDGEEAHENVAVLAKPIARDENVRIAVEKREKPICIYEFDVAFVHKGVPIIGKVDEAWFRGGDIELVVERKFSDKLSVYSPYHIQAQLYCLGLGRMGFNTARTSYKIMIFKRGCLDCPELSQRSCAILALGTSYFRCIIGEARAFTYPFSQVGILRELDWAVDFWLGKREAIPTKNGAKCQACEYKSLCSLSLAK